MKTFKAKEEAAWNYFTTHKCEGNAHFYQKDDLSFNGKECITLFDAAEKGREEFKKAFSIRHNMFLYWKSMEV